jgi:hypothetical protein
MKSIALAIIAFALQADALADCPTGLPVTGVLTVDNCTGASPVCRPAEQAVWEYSQAMKDDGPAVLSIALHGSPWHVYDREFHIIDIDELAAMVRKQGNKIKRVTLHASWSGTAPPMGKSIAQRLSTALNGMPVSGQEGFVWYAKNGAVSTTRQAFTAMNGVAYQVAKDQKVMASLAAGWFVFAESHFVQQKDGQGMLRVGAGADIFLLCPERALKAFEDGAALSNPVAAYNAALMRLERNGQGDQDAALSLLNKAAVLGDKKAIDKLRKLQP